MLKSRISEARLTLTA